MEERKLRKVRDKRGRNSTGHNVNRGRGMRLKWDKRKSATERKKETKNERRKREKSGVERE